MKKTLIIFGGSSTALEILDTVNQYFNSHYENVYNIVGENEKSVADNVLTDDEIDDFQSDDNIYYIVSMSNQALRTKSHKIAMKNGFNPVSIIHPKTCISNTATIGKGVYLAANSIVSSNSEIKNNVVINYNCVIGHDSIIHDDVIISPGAVIGGRAIISNKVNVGANCFVHQGCTVGAGTSVDALSYVYQDIKPRSIASNRNLKIFP